MRDIAPILASLVCVLFIAGIPVLLIVYVIGMYRRADNLLSSWAARNGYRIIESERRKILKGPFFLTSSNNQIVYRVTVQDTYGNVHRGWVRCGSYNLGSWTDEVAVRWDD
jgi:hypothetical protein